MEHNFDYDEHEHEHEVYGGDIPDDGEMDADIDMSSGRADEEGYDAEPSNANSKVVSQTSSLFFSSRFHGVLCLILCNLELIRIWRI